MTVSSHISISAPQPVFSAAVLKRALKALLVVLSLNVTMPAFAQDVDGDEGAPEEAPRSAKQTIILEGFNFAVFKRGNLDGYLTLVVVLELDRSISVPQIEQQMPLLRNELMMAGKQLAKDRVRAERPTNPSVAAWYMQRAVDRVVEPGMVRALIDDVIYRPR